MAEPDTTPIIVAPDRCAPGGPSGPSALDWATRVGFAALGLAALWFVVVALRPLPGGEAPQTPVIPALASIDEGIAPIVVRQQRVAQLNDGGNLFAPDRNNWPVRIAAAPQTGDEAPAQQGRGEIGQPTTAAATPAALGEIEITTNASVAVKKRLEQLKLRGIAAIGDRAVAMIGQKTNSSSEMYRVGDTFDEGEWRVVAIDPALDRVIVSRSGQNFELTLYDTANLASGREAQPRSTISATNAPGDVEIGFTSLDKVATELRDAGLARDEINELITLAQEQPDETTDEAGAEPSDENAKQAAIPPAMPPGMVQLFKAMAEGSREVASPTPKPAQADGDKAQADKPAEESKDKK